MNVYCYKCGKQNSEDSKFCIHCGVILHEQENVREPELEQSSAVPKRTANKFLNLGNIISVLVVLAIIGYRVYGSIDNVPIATNNEALSSFHSGDNKSASEKFRQAADEAATDETKITALTNLGYVYSTDNQSAQAIDAFKEALVLVNPDTFDYYLLSGEIALLEGKINDALTNYNSAYRLDPEDFQINNALALFHIDLDGIAPKYVDYKKALLYAKKAYELSPSEISKQNLAIAHYFNYDYSDTINLLSSSNFTQHPYSAYWIGLAYVASEDDINGRKYLRIAVDQGAVVPQEIHEYLRED